MIRDLYPQGIDISETYRKTGYARKTVRKYLNKKRSFALFHGNQPLPQIQRELLAKIHNYINIYQ